MGDLRRDGVEHARCRMVAHADGSWFPCKFCDHAESGDNNCPLAMSGVSAKWADMYESELRRARLARESRDG